MALKRLLLAMLAFAPAAGAAELQLRIDQAGCPGYKRVQKRWVRMTSAESARLFPAGSELTVRTFGSASDQYLVARDGQSYSLKTSCFAGGDGAATSAATARPRAASPRGGGPGKLYLQVGFGGWQETMNAVDGTGASLTTISNNVGICPGAGYRQGFQKSFDWDANACFFLGGSDATIQGGTVGVYGILASLGVLWTPEGQTAQFGFGIPILFRHQSISGGDSATTLDSASSFQTGLELESRFGLGPHFVLDPRAGYLLGTKRFFWDLNIAYTL